MQKEIKATERPQIPYETPNFSQYLRTFKEHLIKGYRSAKPYTQNDASIQALFSHRQSDLNMQCEHFAKYIADAFGHYAVDDFTHAYYPGMPSQQGAKMDAMEGCSRILPTLAIWSCANVAIEGGLFDDSKQTAIAWLKQAFIAGTDPQHKGYWGEIQNYDQRTCESADLALALWISKSQVWDSYTPEQQVQIVAWFDRVNHVQVVDNNWHLFPLTVQLVIQALTGINKVETWRYERVKEFNVGDGWFRDGAKGNYDYYNAWGFYYSLYWIDQIDPQFDREYIRNNLYMFSENFRYLFTPTGFPFFGRSACYRLAATVPLIAALDCKSDDSSGLSAGEVKRALQTNLSYFIANGALKYGVPTQGLFESDARLTDNYSGPASSLWSLRALNMALFCGQRTGLWMATEALLQVEKEDFLFHIPSIDATVIGRRETKEVSVIFEWEYTLEQTPQSRKLLSQNLKEQCCERLIGRAFRPKNNLLRKGVTCYSSKMANFF